jgi:hypothetical protein
VGTHPIATCRAGSGEEKPLSLDKFEEIDDDIRASILKFLSDKHDGIDIVEFAESYRTFITNLIKEYTELFQNTKLKVKHEDKIFKLGAKDTNWYLGQSKPLLTTKKQLLIDCALKDGSFTCDKSCTSRTDTIFKTAHTLFEHLKIYKHYNFVKLEDLIAIWHDGAKLKKIIETSKLQIQESSGEPSGGTTSYIYTKASTSRA